MAVRVCVCVCVCVCACLHVSESLCALQGTETEALACDGVSSCVLSLTIFFLLKQQRCSFLVRVRGEEQFNHAY